MKDDRLVPFERFEESFEEKGVKLCRSFPTARNPKCPECDTPLPDMVHNEDVSCECGTKFKLYGALLFYGPHYASRSDFLVALKKFVRVINKIQGILKQNDLQYFERAMQLATEAFEGGYSPVGAIVVNSEGEYIGMASRREIGNVYHAEFLSLLEFQKDGLTRTDLILYSTLEPCIMCSGMAAIMKVKRIAWLVDDVWAGASRVYNPDNAYIKQRFPEMGKVDIPDLHKEAQDLWVEYLVRTGHSDAVQFMLGLE